MAGVVDSEVGGFQSGGGSLAERLKLHSALIVIHAAYGGYFVIAKACLTGGVDPFVFAVYRDAIGCSVLFFYAAIFERHHWQKMSLGIVGSILVMAFVGVYLLQGLFLIGLQYTNVIFSSIMMNTIPIWTFLMAVMMRIEMIHYKRRDGQAKILGIVVCVIGATLITVYKGPAIFGVSNPSPTSGLQKQPSSGFSAAIQNWGIDEWHFGALCLLFSCFSASAFLNLQFVALSKFPAPFTLMSGSTFGGAILFIASSLLTFKDASPWFLPPGPDFIAVIYAGVIASGMVLFLQCYATQNGGPILVGAYAPLQPVFTTFFSFIFLGETLFFGSLFGAILILLGLYLVIWGQREAWHLSVVSSDIPLCLDENIIKSNSSFTEPLLGLYVYALLRHLRAFKLEFLDLNTHQLQSLCWSGHPVLEGRLIPSRGR